MAVVSVESLLLCRTTTCACSKNQVCIGQCVHVHISHSEAFVSSLWSVWDVHRALCMKRNACVRVCACALIRVYVETLAWKCFDFGRGIKKILLSVCVLCVHVAVCLCVCARTAELHVWESLLRSGAMEHHIVVVRGWDDDCLVCSSSYSVVTALSRLMLDWHTNTLTKACTTHAFVCTQRPLLGI